MAAVTARSRAARPKGGTDGGDWPVTGGPGSAGWPEISATPESQARERRADGNLGLAKGPLADGEGGEADQRGSQPLGNGGTIAHIR